MPGTSTTTFSQWAAARWPLLGYLREFHFARWRVLLAATLAIIKHSPVLLLPLYTGYMIDSVIPRGDMTDVLLVLAGMVSLIIMNVAVHPLYVRLYSRVRREVALRLRARMCNRIQQLSFTWHDRQSSGRLHSKVMQDVEKLDRMGQLIIDPLLVMILTTLAAGVYILVKEPKIGRAHV